MSEEVRIWGCNVEDIYINPEEYLSHTLTEDTLQLKGHVGPLKVYKVEIYFKSGQKQRWYFDDIKYANNMYDTINKQINDYLRKKK